MRQFHALLLLGSTILGSAASAAPSLAIPPILTGAPSAKAIDARCDWYVARSTAMRHALESTKGASTVATTLVAFDRLNELLSDGGGEATLYREVSPTAASRAAGEKCENRISSENTKLNLSRPIYERLKAIKAPPGDPATQLYLTRTLQGFERSGIGLDTAGRAKAQELSDRASNLSTEFTANIPKGQHTIETTTAELDG